MSRHQKFLIPNFEFQIKLVTKIMSETPKQEEFPTQETSGKTGEGYEKESKEKQGKDFLQFDKVSLIRSSGKTEDDWTVYGYRNDEVIVIKTDRRGNLLKKIIPESELKKFQGDWKKFLERRNRTTISDDALRVYAIKEGIDVSKSGWEKEIQKKLEM